MSESILSLLRRSGVFVLLIAAAGILNSCNPDVLYTESASVKKDGWAMGDTLDFSVPVEARESGGDLYLWIRHSQDYAYSNIFVKVVTDLDIEEQHGLVEIRLADKSGRWLGTCSQSMCTARVLLRKNLEAPEPGTYGLSVVQYMRESVLGGVRNIGVEIRKGVPEEQAL